MGFLDKAKAAANDLAAKADTKLASSGLGGPGAQTSNRDADRYFRDLGVLTYLEASGRPAPSEERERLLTALSALETGGTLGTLTLQTAPPPPPGSAASTPPSGFAPPPPPPPGGGAPPPPSGDATPAPLAQTPPPAPGSSAPAPPPPSWMTKDDNGSI
jgi:hypothetical protein